jgi:hypothetical protein
MINPIPKNGMFAALSANDVANIINGIPEKYRSAAYLIYFGTVNMCSEHVDATIKAYTHSSFAEGVKSAFQPIVPAHRDAKEYPVVTD